MGGRFAQKVDPFLLFFLSVREGGGGAGACSPDFVFNPCAAKTVDLYIRFQTNFRLKKITLKFVTNLVVDAQ